MKEFRDRPSDGIGFMDSVLMVFVVLVVLCVAIAAAWLTGLIYYGRQDFEPEVTAQIEREVAEKRALPPEEYAYWKRHERNSRLCRGQRYLEQCCTDARPILTCLTPEEQ